MGTKLKTVSYSGFLNSIGNNALTAFSPFTVTLPESSKVFKSVILTFVGSDVITATGGSITTKTLQLGLNGGTKTSFTNSNTLANSGENLAFTLVYDYTTHFINNWSGTSMAVDVNVQINQTTGTTFGITNISLLLEITYEYDDTSATQIKTVFIPLNAPTGALPTAAGTNINTLPAINTYFPESNKVIRDIFLIINFNEASGIDVTNLILYLRVGSVNVNYTFEKALATNRFVQMYIKLNTYLTTPSLHDFPHEIEFYSNIAAFNHMQAIVAFTYEYSEVNSTQIFNSLKLPMEVASPFGGPTINGYQRATRDLWIQEPGPITTEQLAFFVYWNQSVNLSGLRMRLGTGAFQLYTDNVSVVAGSSCAMIRNDTALTLNRGKNTLNFDAYTTSSVSLGWGISGFWIINYISNKSNLGSGSHNHSVIMSITDQGTGPVESKRQTELKDIQIPETEYFINALGTEFVFLTSGTASPGGFSIQIERLASEGGIQWEVAYKDMLSAENEVGVYLSYSQMRDIFKRFPDDIGVERIDIETARRWRIFSPISTTINGSGWGALKLLLTYHSISYTVEGSVEGLTGNRTIDLWRSTGEKFKTQSLPSDGSFNFIWYDNTVPIFFTAKDSTKMLVSKTNLPDQLFSIGSTGQAGGPTYYAR